MRGLMFGLCAVVLAAGGCVLVPFKTETNATPANQPLASRATKPSGATVRPETVREETAHKVAKALQEELEGDTGAVTPPPVPEAKSEKK